MATLCLWWLPSANCWFTLAFLFLSCPWKQPSPGLLLLALFAVLLLLQREPQSSTPPVLYRTILSKLDFSCDGLVARIWKTLVAYCNYMAPHSKTVVVIGVVQ
jgi:hypothetical protein